MTAQSKLTVVFALLVALPAAWVLGLAWSLQSDRDAVAKMELDGLLNERLADLQRPVMQELAAVERTLLEVFDGDTQDSGLLRDLRRRVPLVSQVFVLDPRGQLTFPPDDASRSQAEVAFVERTRDIWQGRAVLYEPPSPEPSTLSSRGGVQIEGDDLISLATRRPFGWVVWYWQDGLRLLFWRRGPDGGVRGAEVERVVLLSRLLGGLADLGVAEDRVVLVDSRGDPVQQWGPYDAPVGAGASARLRLPHPLDGLSLQYFLSPDRGSALLGASSPWGTALAALAALGVLVGLGLYAYRESTRQVREASQRVNFVTQVSHELKTPLANIRLYAELLEEELETDEGARRRVGIIVSESQRLARLIENVLVFAKVRRGTHRVEPRTMQVDDAIRRVLDQFAPALSVKGITSEVDLQAHLPCFADPDAVEQVLANLISNVDKYGASGGCLVVRSWQQGLQTRVVVGDRGPGIAKGSRARIFDPFYRISDALSDGVTGTGIGLAIAKQLAQETGGHLVLLDDHPGAWFQLTLNNPQESS